MHGGGRGRGRDRLIVARGSSNEIGMGSGAVDAVVAGTLPAPLDRYHLASIWRYRDHVAGQGHRRQPRSAGARER